MVFWRRLTLVADTMHALSTERTAIDAALLL
jgi:hypothetical protein